MHNLHWWHQVKLFSLASLWKKQITRQQGTQFMFSFYQRWLLLKKKKKINVKRQLLNQVLKICLNYWTHSLYVFSKRLTEAGPQNLKLNVGIWSVVHEVHNSGETSYTALWKQNCLNQYTIKWHSNKNWARSKCNVLYSLCTEFYQLQFQTFRLPWAWQQEWQYCLGTLGKRYGSVGIIAIFPIGPMLHYMWGHTSRTSSGF